jgi:hypothetical protein
MVLQCNDGGEFKPHPEGIHPAVCVGVINLGMMKTEFQGLERIVPKVKLVFETEQKMEDGRNYTVSKNYTASLHPKARLSADIGKWRGRPVTPPESLDLENLIGASCTLVVSHQKNLVGKIYASIDVISKPTKKVTPSGGYDLAAAKQRVAEWKVKQALTPAPTPATPLLSAPVPKGPPPAMAPSEADDSDSDVPF